MDNCIFCKIVDGKIPCAKVYEDKNFLAFLDIGPVSKGHVLVIPKKHYRWVWDIANEESKLLMPVVQKIAKAVEKATRCNLVVMSVVGDEVPHAHIHLIPKFHGDGLNFWPKTEYAKGEMEEFCKKIAKELK